MPRLLIKDGPGSGDLFELGQEEAPVGRDPENALRVADRTVSRFHAVVKEEKGVYHVRDLDSHNGTQVNGQRVRRRPLFHMDEIRLGNVVLVYLEEDVTDIDALLQSHDSEPEITQTINLDEVALDDVTAGSRQELVASNQRLRALTELGQAAGTVRSLPPLLDLLIDSISRTLAPDRVVPILRQEDGSLMPYIRSRSQFARGMEEIGISKAAVEHCLEKGVAALSRSRPRKGAPAGGVPAGGAAGGHRIASVLCAPLKVGSKVRGVVYCDRVGRAEGYKRPDLQYISLLANQIAVAMANIRDMEQIAARARNLELAVEGEYDILGQSPSMLRVYDFIHKASPTDASVLICGESGTGKELVARAIHHHSRRSKGTFEAVNCAAMSPTLIESELFGHVQGAFTGAVADHPGRFELANEGTIFLDEIGTLPLECQTKLLRVLEEETVRRVGDVKDRAVDLRVVAASNQDLDRAQREGAFREDLFYRLNVLRADLPPLRERGDDIDLLANHFLQSLSEKCGRTLRGFSAEVASAFRLYRWPGNVRELKNVVERMVIMGEEEVLEADLLPPELKEAVRTEPAVRQPADVGTTAMQPLEQVEKRYILEVLRRTNGNKKKAAEILGMDRSTLYAKLKRFEPEPQADRAGRPADGAKRRS
ncbi:MAG: sigma 54-interacting transcriptional regulator [Candidatus Brocadiia bacterium]|jgi:transcriptional regulator with GAF, ATPase, and Fis domain|nr:sigma 54-interacting transcriptional regulator [Candidatus Brocadiia bacterium]